MVRAPAPPLHPRRIVEQLLRVLQAGPPQELHDVVIGVREAEDLPAHRNPPAARTKRRVHDYRSAPHTSRVRRGRAARSSCLVAQKIEHVA